MKRVLLSHDLFYVEMDPLLLSLNILANKTELLKMKCFAAEIHGKRPEAF